MKLLFEPILTFFQLSMLLGQPSESGSLGLVTMTTSLLNAYIYPQFLVNFPLGVSFLVTAYRPILDVCIILILKIVSTLLASACITLIGTPPQPFTSEPYSIFHVIFFEILFNFYISLIYYCMNVDLKNKGNPCNAAAVACIHGLGSVTFPNLPMARMMQVLATMSTDTGILFGSILGGVTGAVLGGIFYRAFICGNSDMKMREIENTSKNNKINF